MTRLATLASATLLFAALASHAQAPCTLLTPDQMNPVIGTQVQAGQPGQAPANDCTWKDSKGEDRVYLSLRDPKDFSSLRESMASTGRLVPITGLSGDAFFVSSTGSSAALYALKGKHVILLTVTGVDFSKAQNEAAEKSLATQILDKL
jgi:hypothetical protein